MKITSMKLADGVAYKHLSVDKFKFNEMCVRFFMPLDAKRASLQALLAAVLSRGCAKYKTITDITVRSQELYSASVNFGVQKAGEVNCFTVSMSCLDNKYSYDGTDIIGGSMELLSEMLFNPLVNDNMFLDEYVKTEKKNLIDKIISKMNDKTSYALNRCNEIMCAGELFSVSSLGDIEVIEKITAAELYEEYLHIINQTPLIMVYCGSAADSVIRGYISKYLNFKPRTDKLPVTNVVKTVGEVKNITEEMDINQGKLNLGFRTGVSQTDPEKYAIRLFYYILGMSPSSKLFVNVREKMSLCYYCQPVVESNKGVMTIVAGIDVKNKQIAIDAILKELDDIRNGNVTEDEMMKSKKVIRNGLLELFDSPGSLIGMQCSNYLNNDEVSIEELMNIYENLTIGEVVAASKKVLLDTVYFLSGK